LALSLFADECVDARIVAGLRRRGIDVVTVSERGLLGRPDERHLEEARTLARVILSRDQDFLVLAHRCATDGVPFPGLIFIQSSAMVGEVIRTVALLAMELSPEAIAGWIEWVP
jgi:predicted nuclease of predicted toxin-antitoxin system